ncbi:MAG: alpha/beta hydrolase [bacterium]|nr:alpha/beta hydrolase [bacterium]
MSNPFTLPIRLFLFSIIAVLSITAAGIAQADAARDGQFRGKDVTLHYKVHGDKGDYVILLSGGPGSDVGYMQPVADALKDSYRCVMLEQRGTGRSKLGKLEPDSVRMELYVEDLELLRQHLRAPRLILIGNSWGAMLGLLYSGTYPDRVEKLITAGSPVITDKYADIMDDNLRSRLLPEVISLRNEWRDKARKDPSLFRTASYERDKLVMPVYYYSREIGLKMAIALRPDDVNYDLGREFGRAYPSFDIRPTISRIKAPTLLIHGRQDPSPESSIVETHDLIKGSVLTFIERCGHTPWEENPAATFKLMREFLLKAKICP